MKMPKLFLAPVVTKARNIVVATMYQPKYTGRLLVLVSFK